MNIHVTLCQVDLLFVLSNKAAQNTIDVTITAFIDNP